MATEAKVAESGPVYYTGGGETLPRLNSLPRDERLKLIRELEKQMQEAARQLEFEQAAILRDQVIELRRSLHDDEDLPAWERIKMLDA